MSEQTVQWSNKSYWSIVGFGVFSCLLAGALDGAPRIVWMIGIAISALLAILWFVRYPLADEHMVEVTYRPPKQGLLSLLYFFTNIFFILSTVIIVLALAIALGWVEINFREEIILIAPWFSALHVGGMALSGRVQLELEGRQDLAWADRPLFYGTVFVTLFAIAGLLVALVKPDVQIGPLTFGTHAAYVFMLTAVLQFNIAIFLWTGVPNLITAVTKALSDNEVDVEERDTPPVVYAGVIAIAVMVATWFILQRFNLIDKLLEGVGESRGIYLLIMVPMGIAAFFLYSVLGTWREGRRGLYKQKIPTKLRNDLLVYGLTGLIGGALSVVTIGALSGRIESIGPIDINVETSKDLILATVVVIFGPIGIYLNRQARELNNIEERLADFLSDLAETRRAGLTLTAALHTASLTDYGALSPEIKRMANQVAWGIPFTHAMAQFSERVKSSLVERSANLVIEAARTGGSVAGILKAASLDAREIKTLEAERRVTLTTYLIIIYVTFFVFMVVLGTLDVTFVPQVIASQEAISGGGSLAGSGSTFGGGNLDRDALRFTYFNAAVVQAIGNGLVAGVLVEQRVTAGFRHVAFMVFSSWLTFRWILNAMG